MQDKSSVIDKTHYQMYSEPYGGNSSKLFALLFKPPNTTDRYYVLPQGRDHEAILPLTLHKNPKQDRFIFEVNYCCTN